MLITDETGFTDAAKRGLWSISASLPEALVSGQKGEKVSASLHFYHVGFPPVCMTGYFQPFTSKQLGIERKFFWFNMILKHHPRTRYCMRHAISGRTEKGKRQDSPR